MTSFIEELLLESEQKEKQQHLEMNRLKADQVLSALAVLEQKAAEVNQLADQEIKIVEDYRQAELQRIEKQASWLAWNLEQFMRRTNRDDPGCKSIALPHGSLKLRLGRDKVEVTDLAKFVPVGEKKGLLRQVPESFEPDLQKIASYIKATGVILPGVVVTPASTKFSYTTLKGNNNGNGKAAETGAEAE